MPYYINDVEASISPEPNLKDGINFVPLRQVLDNVGGSVKWSDDGKIANVTLGLVMAAVQMDNGTVLVNAKMIDLPAKPYVEGEMLFVPWQFFRDALGYKANVVGDKFYLYTG